MPVIALGTLSEAPTQHPESKQINEVWLSFRLVARKVVRRTRWFVWFSRHYYWLMMVGVALGITVATFTSRKDRLPICRFHPLRPHLSWRAWPAACVPNKLFTKASTFQADLDHAFAIFTPELLIPAEGYVDLVSWTTIALLLTAHVSLAIDGCWKASLSPYVMRYLTIAVLMVVYKPISLEHIVLFSADCNRWTGYKGFADAPPLKAASGESREISGSTNVGQWSSGV